MAFLSSTYGLISISCSPIVLIGSLIIRSSDLIIIIKLINPKISFFEIDPYNWSLSSSLFIKIKF